MGALAPVSSWIPEDDVLLKNAVEAGASLESLAKGAVQFSRKFTFRELQERWRALLYDPVVSAEAALHMIDFERSTPGCPSKFSRPGNSKEIKGTSGKRRADSVRSCFYALRKRICSEPFDAMDLSYLVGPSNSNCIGNENEALSGHCMLGEAVANQFAIQEANFDIHDHPFPQIGEVGLAYELEAQYESGDQEDYALEQHNIHAETQSVLGSIVSHTRSGSLVEEFGQTKQLAVNSDGDFVHEDSKFDRDQLFSSPTQECGSLLPELVYSSPLPEIPIWDTVHDVPTTGIPVDLGLREDMQKVDTFSLRDDGDPEIVCPSQYTVIQMDSNLEQKVSRDELNNATGGTERSLAEISDTLLNLDDELMDTDGKDMIRHYAHLDDFWLSLSNDDNHDHIANDIGHEQSVSQDFVIDDSGGCPGMLEQDKASHHHNDAVCVLDVPCLSFARASSMEPNSEDLGGNVCCALNTEDQEIPCNDHVVFTSHLRPKVVLSLARRRFPDGNTSNSSSAKELPSNKKADEGPLSIQRNLNNGQSHVSSLMISPHLMPELGLDHPVVDSRVNCDLPNNDCIQKSAGFAHDSTRIISGNAGVQTPSPAKPKEDFFTQRKPREDSKETAMTKHPCHNSINSLIEKQGFVSDGCKYPDKNANCVKEELDFPERIQNRQALHAKIGPGNVAELENVANHSLSEPEEPPAESDDDVPSFSDVEAMILDRDLDPEDWDLCCCEEVSRFQDEGTKRLVIRLEQGAQSCTHRAIASHGALACIYGRNSKHYIKKHEVLLGRGTQEVDVDIDLGRERQANKISRRQATINLDKNGSFHLKNLGKFPISVNEKDVAPGQSLSLTSGCLIEVTSFSSFNFEFIAMDVLFVLRSVGNHHRSC
ncbi:hypothetical protein Tsubulata_032478 [Turnera subulata]|uniref:FHA domain-containing protein n=1 Tax=Turnera subulata TaxID=218843 RepID=A0A9Q0FC41_9ROSI|nr:hypothetical protein Tsubulata_032478 [Turnera subulata]